MSIIHAGMMEHHTCMYNWQHCAGRNEKYIGFPVPLTKTRMWYHKSKLGKEQLFLGIRSFPCFDVWYITFLDILANSTILCNCYEINFKHKLFQYSSSTCCKQPILTVKPNLWMKIEIWLWGWGKSKFYIIATSFQLQSQIPIIRPKQKFTNLNPQISPLSEAP